MPTEPQPCSASGTPWSVAEESPAVRGRPTPRHLGVLALLLAFFQCGGPKPSPSRGDTSAGAEALVTSTGGAVNEDGSSPGSPCGAAAPGDARPLASLEEGCGELTAARLLEGVASNYSATLGVRGLYPSTSLGVRTEYRGGEILCRPGQSAPPGTAGPDVMPSISVTVEIRLLSADGAFDETFLTPITGGGGEASFCHTVPPEGLGGGFDPAREEAEDTRVVFAGSFAGPKCVGSISLSRRRSGGASGLEPVAYWSTEG